MSELSQVLDDHVDIAQRIVVEFKDGKPVAFMDGYWNGNLLKSAIRSIEHAYVDVRRRSTIESMKKSQIKEK